MRLKALREIAAVVALVVAPHAFAGEPWAFEWADHPKNSSEYPGDTIFVRKLYCPDPQKSFAGCTLTVITLGRAGKDAPLFVDAFYFQTAAGTLRIARRGDTLDIEADLGTVLHKLAVKLVSVAKGLTIVRQASGLLVRSPAEGRAIRAAELVAYVQGSPGFDGREFVAVDLGGSKLTVVGAREPSK